MGKIRKSFAVITITIMGWAAMGVIEGKGMTVPMWVNYTILVIGPIILMMMYWPEIKGFATVPLRKLTAKPVTQPETANWINWDLATRIIRDHPVCHKQMQNRPRRYGQSDLDVRIETEADRYSYEMALAKGILGRIVETHPHAKKGNKKWTHDEYLEHVIEEELDKMMLGFNGK